MMLRKLNPKATEAELKRAAGFLADYSSGMAGSTWNAATREDATALLLGITSTTLSTIPLPVTQAASKAIDGTQAVGSVLAVSIVAVGECCANMSYRRAIEWHLRKAIDKRNAASAEVEYHRKKAFDLDKEIKALMTQPVCCEIPK